MVLCLFSIGDSYFLPTLWLLDRAMLNSIRKIALKKQVCCPVLVPGEPKCRHGKKKKIAI